MPISLEERIDLAEEHILGLFMEPRTVSTILGVPRDETERLMGPSQRGELTLEQVGLTRDDVAGCVERVGTPSREPEVDAIRAAYLVLAVNRDLVCDCIRDISETPGMRL